MVQATAREGMCPPSSGYDGNQKADAEKRASLILASGSPRRAELLKGITSSFRIVPSANPESSPEDEEPRAYALRMAREKAETVARDQEAENDGCWVLSADTVVALEGAILGKPADADHARWMLGQLQDRMHEVITGICLLNRGEHVCCLEAVQTRVWMRRIEPEEIEAYIRTGEPFDKAGGYAIQGQGGRFVRKIEGSYTNVVGLPTERIKALFREYRVI